VGGEKESGRFERETQDNGLGGSRIENRLEERVSVTMSGGSGQRSVKGGKDGRKKSGGSRRHQPRTDAVGADGESSEGWERKKRVT